MSDVVIDSSQMREAINRSLEAILADAIAAEIYLNDSNFHYFVEQIVRTTVCATVEVIEGRSRRPSAEELQAKIGEPLISRDEVMKLLES